MSMQLFRTIIFELFNDLNDFCMNVLAADVDEGNLPTTTYTL